MHPAQGLVLADTFSAPLRSTLPNTISPRSVQFLARVRGLLCKERSVLKGNWAESSRGEFWTVSSRNNYIY